MMKIDWKNFIYSDKGAAGIEFAFVFPFMVLMYFGLVDVTGLISFNRKVTAAASLTADLVAQQKNSILKGQIQDTYNAVEMIMSPTPMSNVRVEVYGFRKKASAVGGVSQEWSTNNGQGPACANAMTPATYLPLMSVDNDIVVARTCLVFSPYVAGFLGHSIMGATSFPVSAAIAVRPRASLKLDCFVTTVGPVGSSSNCT
jgi:Flp pilus assembly protein TadG